jgi:hypothetical protein
VLEDHHQLRPSADGRHVGRAERGGEVKESARQSAYFAYQSDGTRSLWIISGRRRRDAVAASRKRALQHRPCRGPRTTREGNDVRQPHCGPDVALDPTPTQVRNMRSHCGAARVAFNWGLARVKAVMGQREAEATYGISDDGLTPSISWSLYSLRKEWNAAKGEVAPWWGECSKEAFNTGLDGLARALKNWGDSRPGKRKGAPVGFPGSSPSTTTGSRSGSPPVRPVRGQACCPAPAGSGQAA